MQQQNQLQQQELGEIKAPLYTKDEMLKQREQYEAVEDAQEYKYKDDNQTAYQNCLLCCGNATGCLRTWIPFPCCIVNYPFKTIKQSNVGLLTRFGSYVKTLPAGMHYYNVCGEQVEIIDIKLRATDLHKQSILTKDNLTVSIDASVFWRIVNPIRARYRVDNVGESIQFLTFQTVRNVAGQHTLQELLEERSKISEIIQQMVQENVHVWGAHIEQVFIRDIILPPESQMTLASAAKQKRIAESKIIAAQAEVEAAKLMQQSAGILNIAPAMQIRYFETIQRISRCQNNSKIIFLPFDQDQQAGQSKEIKQIEN